MAQYRIKDNGTQAAAGVFIGPIDVPQDRACSIAIQTDHDNDANAAMVLEFTLNKTTFLTLAAIDPTDAATVKTSYTGVDKAGVVPLNAGAVAQVQVRRTDASGGLCRATLSINSR